MTPPPPRPAVQARRARAAARGQLLRVATGRRRRSDRRGGRSAPAPSAAVGDRHRTDRRRASAKSERAGSRRRGRGRRRALRRGHLERHRRARTSSTFWRACALRARRRTASAAVGRVHRRGAYAAGLSAGAGGASRAQRVRVVDRTPAAADDLPRFRPSRPAPPSSRARSARCAASGSRCAVAGEPPLAAARALAALPGRAFGLAARAGRRRAAERERDRALLRALARAASSRPSTGGARAGARRGLARARPVERVEVVLRNGGRARPFGGRRRGRRAHRPFIEAAAASNICRRGER